MPKCQNEAAYRYTWAGQDESYICEEHVRQLKGICEAMGYYCQTIPYEGVEQCRQNVKEGK